MFFNFFLNDINHFFRRRWHFINENFLKTPLLDFCLYCFEILDNHLACLIISNVTKNSVFCISKCYHDIVFTNIRGRLSKTHLVVVYYLFEINIIWYVYSWKIFHIYYSITNTGLKRLNWWLYIHYLRLISFDMFIHTRYFRYIFLLQLLILILLITVIDILVQNKLIFKIPDIWSTWYKRQHLAVPSRPLYRGSTVCMYEHRCFVAIHIA